MKPTVTKFYNYIHGKSSMRLYNIIVFHFNPPDEEISVEKITEKDFLNVRGAGRGTWKEFVGLRDSFLEKCKKTGRGGKREGAGKKPARTDGNKKTKRAEFLFSNDVYGILKQIDNKNFFVETAIIEKWQRENNLTP